MEKCVGLVWLGLCGYDPASPSANYFTLGNAVTALAFTLAVQNFLKPIYEFRLKIRYVTISRLYSMVFMGAFCCLIAAIVPRVPALHWTPFGYAILWELLATLLFLLAYGTVAYAATRPIKVRPERVPQFAQAAAKLLSEADEAGHLELLKDLKESLPVLIKLAAFAERDRFEETTAFYDFIHRHKLEQASYAHTFLRIVADNRFCRTLVDRAPWEVARILRRMADDRLYARVAESFISELAHQALLSDDGMMDRELKFHGFGTAPLLSDSLFAEPFIIERYNPLGFFIGVENISPKMIARFNSATVRVFETLIKSRQTHHSYAAFGVKRFYESMFMGLHTIQDAHTYDYHHMLEAHRAVEIASKLAVKLMASVSEPSYQALYVDDLKKYHKHDVLDVLVEIVFDGLNGIANKFRGVEDRFWILGRGAISESFESIVQQPDGMTPFQQRLAIRIVGKLQDNMEGWYPSISRIVFATFGPFQEDAQQQNDTAYKIIKRAAYFEFKKIPELAANKPEKLADFFPDNVTYDIEAQTLIHTYFGGSQAVTDLKTLEVAPVSLIDKSIRRPLTTSEITAVERQIL